MLSVLAHGLASIALGPAIRRKSCIYVGHWKKCIINAWGANVLKGCIYDLDDDGLGSFMGWIWRKRYPFFAVAGLAVFFFFFFVALLFLANGVCTRI